MEAESWQKEQISRAYLHAIAAREGCTIGNWEVDKDGVDATLRRARQMFDVQLKCTHSLRKLSNSYAFDLDVETYDKLRDSERSVPGYLFVMTVPREIEQWIHVQPDEHLLLRCTAYYACIQDKPPVTTTSTTVIRLPFDDRLNGEALKRMFEHARRYSRGEREGMAA